MTQWVSSDRYLDNIWANRNVCLWDTDQLSTADVPGPVVFPCNTTVHWSSQKQRHSFHQTLTSHKPKGGNPKSSYRNIITSSFQATKMVGFLGSDSIQTSLTATNGDYAEFILLVSWSQNTGSQGLVHPDSSFSGKNTKPNTTFPEHPLGHLKDQILHRWILALTQCVHPQLRIKQVSNSSQSSNPRGTVQWSGQLSWFLLTLNTFGFSITISADSLQQYSSTHNLGTNTSLEDTEAAGNCKKTAN